MLWDGNKPRPSKHSQAPLTAECFSGGWTRLLSKQSADRLINRRVCRGACRSIFSHQANTRSFHSRGLLWGDPVTVWVCHFIKIVPLFESLLVKTYQSCNRRVVLMLRDNTVVSRCNRDHISPQQNLGRGDLVKCAPYTTMNANDIHKSTPLTKGLCSNGALCQWWLLCCSVSHADPVHLHAVWFLGPAPEFGQQRWIWSTYGMLQELNAQFTLT